MIGSSTKTFKLSRLAWIPVLTACLRLSVAASAAAPSGISLAEELPRLLGLLPARTFAVVGVQSGAQSDKEVFRGFRSEILFAAGLQGELTPFQPLFEVLPAEQGMLLAWLAQPEGPLEWLALLPGDFQSASVQAAWRAGLPGVLLDEDLTARATPAGQDAGGFPLAVRRPGLLLLGSERAVQDCLKRLSAAPKQPASDVLLPPERIYRIASENQLWGLARKGWLEGDPSDAEQPEGFILKSLAGIRRVEFEAAVGARVDFRMRTETSGDPDARSLAHELVKLTANAAPAEAPEEVRSAMRTARVQSNGRMVELSLQIGPRAMARIHDNPTSVSILRWQLPGAQRERSKRVAELLDSLGLQAGGQVADVGAGSGFMTFRLARRVGPQGRVVAVDILPRDVEYIRQRADRDGLTQIEAVLGASDDPGLGEETLDAVLIVNAYHEMERYAEMLRHIHRALRPGGRLVLSEPFSRSLRNEPRVSQTQRHQIAPELVEAELRQAGFEIHEFDEDFIEEKHQDHRHLEWLIVAVKGGR